MSRNYFRAGPESADYVRFHRLSLRTKLIADIIGRIALAFLLSQIYNQATNKPER
jgi:hypothetical protein